jgi:membrane fusion protein, multidrug efflux system
MAKIDTKTAESGEAPNGRRRRLLIGLAAIFAVAGIAYGAYWAMVARYVEGTEDAYVAGNVVQITPQTAGTVLAIHADDTDFVKAGEPLVQLDEADARVALDQAEAQLAQTVREVRTLYATSDSLAANVALRDADVAKAREDLARRQALSGSGAVSTEEIEHARTALRAAEAALAASREQFTSNRALIDNTTVEQHPNVARAAARVREAYLALQRATIPAPVTGYVAKRAVQLGQRVSPGAPLMAVIPLDQVWVDANFKEGQLSHMRIGQPATLTADIYGTAVKFQGKVAGLSAGTGSAFALLPAQNATGNWIKVVQRVPVRVVLDAKDLAAHPLRVGLSMRVDVSVKDQSGSQLAEGGVHDQPVAQTQVFARDSDGADSIIKQIIAANLHRAVRQASPAPAQRQESVKPAIAHIHGWAQPFIEVHRRLTS